MLQKLDLVSINIKIGRMTCYRKRILALHLSVSTSSSPSSTPVTRLGIESGFLT